MLIKGLYTAHITPFHEDSSLDEEGLIQLLERQCEAHVDGIVLLGTTGETPTLEKEEQERIVSLGRSVIKKDGATSLMVGCGTYSTKETIRNAEMAERLGADSLLVVSPYYNKPTQEGLYRHFCAVAQATSLPICVYNIASRTGVNIETATLMRLAEIPNIRSVKESSGSILQIGDVIDKIARPRSSFTVLSGDDSFTTPLMALGGHGVISVLSNVIPETIKQLIDLFSDPCQVDLAKIQELTYAIKPLFEVAFIETNPAPIKYMAKLLSLPAGPCRLPLTHLSEPSKAKIQTTLHSYLCKETTPSLKSLLATYSTK